MISHLTLKSRRAWIIKSFLSCTTLPVYMSAWNLEDMTQPRKFETFLLPTILSLMVPRNISSHKSWGSISLCFIFEDLLSCHGSSFVHFRYNLQWYNAMFALTSMDGKTDMAVYNGGGSYVFRLNGLDHHQICSLCNSWRVTTNICSTLHIWYIFIIKVQRDRFGRCGFFQIYYRTDRDRFFHN